MRQAKDPWRRPAVVVFLPPLIYRGLGFLDRGERASVGEELGLQALVWTRGARTRPEPSLIEETR